ncbi:lactosylceramide -n-acetyl-beta-d-glucosaminyltransferase, partial [Biomphalaria pfeifferi]
MLKKLIKFRRSPLFICLFFIVLVSTVSKLYFGSQEEAVDKLGAVVGYFERKTIHEIRRVESELEIKERGNETTRKPIIEPRNTSVKNALVRVQTQKLPVIKKSATALRKQERPSYPASRNGTWEKSPKNFSVKKADKKIDAIVSTLKQAISTTVRPHQTYFTDLKDSTHYDPYLKTVMDIKAGCQNASSYDAIMAVHSAPKNAAKRNMFRWLYSDYQKTSPYKIKVYFFVGQVKTFAAQSNLVAENVKYNDVIQGSFYDAYVNLTYKAIFVFKWLNEHCQGLRLLLRLDDDVFAGVHQFFDAWKSLVKTEANTIMCDAESNDKVRREGKWLVKKSQIPEDRYFFTHCLGYFVALTPDLVPKIEYSARRTTFFWIDDIFIYGFVATKVGA